MSHLQLPRAILLIGLTGSGKSPLGDCLSQSGIGGRRCLHFDFGNELRAIGESEKTPDGLVLEDTQAIKDFLARSQLLTDDTFYIAEAVWNSFAARHAIGKNDIIVLNGLPRKEQQARGVSAFLSVRSVIFLNCPLAIAIERIRKNSGGDRMGRIDDAVQKIRQKYITFCEDTFPLIACYRRELGDAAVHEVPVEVTTSPPEIVEQIWNTVSADLISLNPNQ